MNAIKYESVNIPPRFREWCEKHADKISAVDYGPGYSHPDDGRDCIAYNVLLRKGWFADEPGLHTVIDPRADYIKKAIREALKCGCPDCTNTHGTDWAETQQTTRHGGTRPGAGRKALDPEGTVVTTLRLTATQKATLTMLGGAAWIREQLDKLA